MTERDHQNLLETVQYAIDADTGHEIGAKPVVAPFAANDNSVKWPLLPFPSGWHASP